MASAAGSQADSGGYHQAVHRRCARTRQVLVADRAQRRVRNPGRERSGSRTPPRARETAGRQTTTSGQHGASRVPRPPWRIRTKMGAGRALLTARCRPTPTPSLTLFTRLRLGGRGVGCTARRRVRLDSAPTTAASAVAAARGARRVGARCRAAVRTPRRDGRCQSGVRARAGRCEAQVAARRRGRHFALQPHSRRRAGSITSSSASCRIRARVSSGVSLKRWRRNEAAASTAWRCQRSSAAPRPASAPMQPLQQILEYPARSRLRAARTARDRGGPRWPAHAAVQARAGVRSPDPRAGAAVRRRTASRRCGRAARRSDARPGAHRPPGAARRMRSAAPAAAGAVPPAAPAPSRRPRGMRWMAPATRPVRIHGAQPWSPVPSGSPTWALDEVRASAQRAWRRTRGAQTRKSVHADHPADQNQPARGCAMTFMPGAETNPEFWCLSTLPMPCRANCSPTTQELCRRRSGLAISAGSEVTRSVVPIDRSADQPINRSITRSPDHEIIRWRQCRSSCTRPKPNTSSSAVASPSTARTRMRLANQASVGSPSVPNENNWCGY